jgi:hypothetical protein
MKDTPKVSISQMTNNLGISYSERPIPALPNHIPLPAELTNPASWQMANASTAKPKDKPKRRKIFEDHSRLSLTK